MDADLRYSVQTLGQIVDAAIGRAEVRLRLLAASDPLQRGDVAEFSVLAQEAAQFGARIVLSDELGNWVVDSGGGHGVAPGTGCHSVGRARRGAAGNQLGPRCGRPSGADGDGAGAARLAGTCFNLTASLRQSVLQAELPQGEDADRVDRRDLR
ncbi:MAG: hypothetical protein WDN04_04490 [Rhodospirillales bacterium]